MSRGYAIEREIFSTSFVDQPENPGDKSKTLDEINRSIKEFAGGVFPPWGDTREVNVKWLQSSCPDKDGKIVIQLTAIVTVRVEWECAIAF